MRNFSPPPVQTKNPDFKNLIEQKLEGQHFMRHIGFKLTLMEEGYMEAEARLQDFHRQQDGFVHGGVTSTISDIVMGFAAFSLVEPDQKVVTADLKINYLNPGKGDTIIAKGYVVKAGKMMIFCEGEIIVKAGQDEILIARAYAIMAVFRPRKSEV